MKVCVEYTLLLGIHFVCLFFESGFLCVALVPVLELSLVELVGLDHRDLPASGCAPWLLMLFEYYFCLGGVLLVKKFKTHSILPFSVCVGN